MFNFLQFLSFNSFLTCPNQAPPPSLWNGPGGGHQLTVTLNQRSILSPYFTWSINRAQHSWSRSVKHLLQETTLPLGFASTCYSLFSLPCGSLPPSLISLCCSALEQGHQSIVCGPVLVHKPWWVKYRNREWGLETFVTSQCITGGFEFYVFKKLTSFLGLITLELVWDGVAQWKRHYTKSQQSWVQIPSSDLIQYMPFSKSLYLFEPLVSSLIK